MLYSHSHKQLLTTHWTLAGCKLTQVVYYEIRPNALSIPAHIKPLIFLN